jgi:hypothetical protein
MKSLRNLTLFKRQTGVYYIAYEDNGKRRWKSTRTKRKNEAIKALTNFQKLTIPHRYAGHWLSSLKSTGNMPMPYMQRRPDNFTTTHLDNSIL